MAKLAIPAVQLRAPAVDLLRQVQEPRLAGAIVEPVDAFQVVALADRGPGSRGNGPRRYSSCQRK